MPLTPSATTSVQPRGQAPCSVQPDGGRCGGQADHGLGVVIRPCGGVSGTPSEEMACPGPGPPCPADSPPLGVPFSRPPVSQNQGTVVTTVIPLAAWCVVAPTGRNPGLHTVIRVGGLCACGRWVLGSVTSSLAPGPGGQGAQGLPLVLGSQPRGPPPHAFWQALRVCRLGGAGPVAHCSVFSPTPALPGLSSGTQSQMHTGQRDLAASLLSGARVHCMCEWVCV